MYDIFVMCRLYLDNANVIKLLEESEIKEKRKNLGEQFEEGECEALVLIAALVTSFVRYYEKYILL